MLKASQIIQTKGIVSRKEYALWGLLLFFIKYNLDRLIALSYDKYWFLTDYFVQADRLGLLEIQPEDKSFYLTILLASLPFIWAGTVLTLKRLRDTDLPRGLLIFFFVPLLNLIFFIILSLLPSKSVITPGNLRYTRFVDKVIPKSKMGSAAVAIGLLSLFAFPGMLFSVYLLGEYGWGLFVAIPFFLGMGSVLIYSHHEKRSFKQSMGVAASSIFLFGALLLVFALEGILCVIMAAPIGVAIGLLGGVIGYYLQGKGSPTSGKVFSATWLLIPLIILGESLDGREASLVSVQTELEIAADKQAIWDQLVAFSTIEEPEEWLFKTGISYPIHAEIKGTGTEAIRYCNFTTGSFVEPIEVWDEPNLLKFSVDEVPPPLVEWSPYDELHLPHLENYFVSEQGQFLLTALPNGNTLLQGTTWYSHNIWPESYWRFWSDFILHKIHFRVLKHIKKEAEKK